MELQRFIFILTHRHTQTHEQRTGPFLVTSKETQIKTEIQNDIAFSITLHSIYFRHISFPFIYNRIIQMYFHLVYFNEK